MIKLETLLDYSGALELHENGICGKRSLLRIRLLEGGV